MTDWMEVFASGRHVAASGKEVVFTTGDLERMATQYDPAKHEAPMVIGHPKANAPAWGWVKKLKVVGNKLLALPGQVAPEFAEMVQAGRFKKRSIAVYPDGTLRHVGFLGAQPPAVKGLQDIEFAEEAEETYEFEEQTMTELERLQQQLAEEQRLRAEAETKHEGLRTEFAEFQEQTRRKEIDEFIAAGVKEGKLLPQWQQAGLAEFIQALDGHTETYEFSEGRQQQPGQWFREFLEGFAAHPLFKEMARPEDDQTGKDTDEFAEDVSLGQEIAAKVNPA